MILMATSLPVGMCLASFTLAKLPFPMVLSSRYFPMWGSSPVRRPLTRELGSPWQISKFNSHTNLNIHFWKYMSKFVRCSSFWVLTSEDTRALLTIIKPILWNSIFALFIASLCFKYWGDVFTCVNNIFHNRLKRVTKYKSSIWEMLKIESDFRANTHYHLSLQECATIKCDHHGIWEGGSGSLCIAPGTGKSGVRQEDPPFQKKYWRTAVQCKSTVH